jgi:hypothetical protein
MNLLTKSILVQIDTNLQYESSDEMISVLDSYNVILSKLYYQYDLNRTRFWFNQ